MNLNGLIIDNRAVLAPMAGFCDIVMRQIRDDYGAGFTVSEMVSARALAFGDKKSRSLMESYPHKGTYGIQLFGFDPEDFKIATKIALEYHPDFIDINMGCPAPKITNNNSGSALMKDTDLAAKIARTVVENAGGLPVSVKMRKGWDDNCITAVELAQKVEKAGVSFIAVHGRTRRQMYTPGIDLDIIKQVKEAVNIPVIGNGDITTPASALKMADYTGCDRVMIGRRALSSPWIFGQVDRAFKGLPIPADPTVGERVELLRRHVKRLRTVNGEEAGIKKARGQTAMYLKGLRGARRLRGMTNTMCRMEDVENIITEILKENADN